MRMTWVQPPPASFSRNFRFAAYLKKCEQEVVIELAEIKHGVWVGLILFVGVELYVKGIIGEATSNAVRFVEYRRR